MLICFSTVLPREFKCLESFKNLYPLNDMQKQFIDLQTLSLKERNEKFCMDEKSRKQLEEERNCYSLSPNLWPMVRCGNMFSNLTDLLLEEISDMDETALPMQALADYMCLIAELSRNCLLMNWNQKCSLPISPTFTEQSINGQFDESYINNFLQLWVSVCPCVFTYRRTIYLRHFLFCSSTTATKFALMTCLMARCFNISLSFFNTSSKIALNGTVKTLKLKKSLDSVLVKWSISLC